MKVLLVAHGFPPEIHGGTENTVRALAHGLAASGDEVVVAAGSMQWEGGFRTSRDVDRDAERGTAVRVVRIHRDDLYFDHWHKAPSARVAEAFAELLASERPDVVHVHHWIRLTRDLVATAARARIPAVVTLHDLWATCLITFRVRPGTDALCRAPLAADPCLACAGSVPPFTPWVDPGQARLLLAEHRADVVRELTLARVLAVPSRAHGAAVTELLGLDPGAVSLEVVPPGSTSSLPRRDLPPPPAGGAPLRLAAWGHLGHLKGTDLLVEAVRRLPDPRRVELHLVGEAAEPAFAAELAERCEGLPVVRHGAYAGPGELATHPGTHAHLMVSGSRAHESWGLVLDEALQLGLPCVLPRAGAFEERAAGAAWARLFAPGDAESLAACLRELLDEPELLGRMVASLPPPAEAVPGLEDHVRTWRALYADAVARGAPEVPAASWWAATLRRKFEESWDASLRARSAAELGFEEASS